MNRSPLRSSEHCSRRHVSRHNYYLRQQRSRLKSRRLFLERLEERSLLATIIWDGGGGDNKWSTALNWVDNVAPVQDDNLIFPASGVQHTNRNDYADGTRFRSITVSAADYVITQDTTNSIVLLEGFVYNGAAAGASFTAPLTLGAAQTFYSANDGASITLGPVTTGNLQQLSIDGRGNMVIGGALSGTGALAKSGDGTLTLAVDNPAYQGIITITQGEIKAQASGSLGAATAGTIVREGGVVLIEGSGLSIPEPLSINLYGSGFDLSTLGAIRNVSGTNTLSGNIALFGSSVQGSGIGVDAGKLIVTGSISGAPGTNDGQFIKFGPGELELGGATDNNINNTVTLLQGTLTLNKTGGAKPFLTNLIIGDNRDGVASPATLRLAAANQIPEVNFFGTGINTVTVNSNGTLDLAGFSDTIGGLTLFTGRSSGAVVQTGAGTLSLLGDITVTNFQGSSGAANPANPDTGLFSAALIKGNLDLGSSFSGAAASASTDHRQRHLPAQPGCGPGDLGQYQRGDQRPVPDRLAGDQGRHRHRAPHRQQQLHRGHAPDGRRCRDRQQHRFRQQQPRRHQPRFQ